MYSPVLRPLVLEYRVRGRLDGITPAPIFESPPSQGAMVGAAQILPRTVENLGLVNLVNGGPDGQAADRFVKWILVVGPNLPVGSDNIGFAFDGVTQRVELSIPPGANGIYSRLCLFIPQTAQLQLDDMVAAPGNPIVVRICVWRPTSLHALAKMQDACCCRASCVDAFGNPCFLQALSPPQQAQISLASVAPGSVARGATTIFTVTGDNFLPTDQFALRQSGGLSQVLINSATFVNPTTFELDVTAADNQPLGDYDLLATRQLGGLAQRAVLPAAIMVT